VLLPFFELATAQEESFREAVKRADVAEVEALLANGVNVDVKSDKSTISLMVASEAGHTEVVRVLLEAGADADAKSAAGETAFIAVTRKDRDALLLEP
jgi:ankyrin repeat protein